MQSLQNFYIESNKGKNDWEVFHATVCAYALLEQRVAEYLKPYNLTPVKFNALMLIKHKGQDAGLSQNEIGRHLIVSPSNITRLLDSLKAEGLINRCAHKTDRRVNLVKITSKGSLLLDKVWPGYCDTIYATTAKLLNKSELSQLSALLLKWFSKLEVS